MFTSPIQCERNLVRSFLWKWCCQVAVSVNESRWIWFNYQAHRMLHLIFIKHLLLFSLVRFRNGSLRRDFKGFPISSRKAMSSGRFIYWHECRKNLWFQVKYMCIHHKYSDANPSRVQSPLQAERGLFCVEMGSFTMLNDSLKDHVVKTEAHSRNPCMCCRW